MYDDNSVVRVTRYVKFHETRNPLTGVMERRRIHLDWGIGQIDGGEGFFIYGPPQQIYSNLGTPDPNNDSHILYLEELLPSSNLPSTSAANPADGSIHLEFPNI